MREREGERERALPRQLSPPAVASQGGSVPSSPLGIQFRLQEIYAFEGLTRPMMPSLPQRIATAHTKFRPFCLPGALPQTVGPRMSSRQVSRKGRRFAKLDQGTDAPAERPDPFQRTGVHWKSPPYPHQPLAGDTSPLSRHLDVNACSHWLDRDESSCPSFVKKIVPIEVRNSFSGRGSCHLSRIVAANRSSDEGLHQPPKRVDLLLKNRFLKNSKRDHEYCSINNHVHCYW